MKLKAKAEVVQAQAPRVLEKLGVFTLVDRLDAIGSQIKKDAHLRLVKAGLWWLLHQYAVRLGVYVAFGTTQYFRDVKVGRGGVQLPLGWYNQDEGLIWLAPGHWFDPWTLAHEIAHHLLAKSSKGWKHGEQQANERARRLVKKFLNNEEFVFLREEMERELAPVPERRKRRR